MDYRKLIINIFCTYIKYDYIVSEPNGEHDMKINYYAEATETLDAVELTSDGDVDGYFIMPRVGEKICLRDNDENEFYLKVVDIIHHHGKGLGFIDIDCKQLENFDKLFDL